MERKLASIQRIKSLDTIPGADSIERATVLGWQCVVKKGEFKVNDLTVYMEVDSVVPDKPEFEFLKPRGLRVKTIKLRKQVSQGICFPMDILPPKLQVQMAKADLEKLVGANVTEALGIKKYMPYTPAQLSGQVKGAFPGFIYKTDETRIQAVPDVLERHKGKKFYVTEKLDGSSMTVYLKDKEFGVCSRNLDMLEDEKNAYWRITRKFDLENKLKSLGKNIALQGELVGQGVQKNKYKFADLDFFIFNVFDIATSKHLNFTDAYRLVYQLGLNMVPEVDNIELNHTIEALVEMSKGQSLLNKETKREGIILRPHQETHDEELGRLSFKVINPDFLLKYDE